MIYLIQSLQCLAFGLMAASKVYYVDETVGKENENTGQAYISATETIGVVLGSALGGILMEKSYIDNLLLSGAIICFIGMILMVFSSLKEKAKH